MFRHTKKEKKNNTINICIPTTWLKNKWLTDLKPIEHHFLSMFSIILKKGSHDLVSYPPYKSLYNWITYTSVLVFSREIKPIGYILHILLCVCMYTYIWVYNACVWSRTVYWIIYSFPVTFFHVFITPVFK